MCHAKENSLPLAPGGLGPAVLGLGLHCFGSEVGDPLSITGEGPGGSEGVTVPSTSVSCSSCPPNTFVLNSVNHGYTSLLRRASWRGQSCDGPGGLLAPPQPREKTQGLRGVRPGTQATQLRRAGLASLWGDLGGGGLPSSCTTFRTLPTHHGILDKSPPLSDGVSGEIRKEGTGAKAQAFVPRGRGMRRLPPMGPQEETAGWSGQVACRALGRAQGIPSL